MNRLAAFVLLAFVFLCGLPPSSFAGTPAQASRNVVGESASEVQSWCHDFTEARYGQNGTFTFRGSPKSEFCWGAFASILILSKTGFGEDPRPILGFCPPDTSSRVQYIKIFSKYVTDHPEIGHADFAHVALSALTQAFPCMPPPDASEAPTPSADPAAAIPPTPLSDQTLTAPKP